MKNGQTAEGKKKSKNMAYPNCFIWHKNIFFIFAKLIKKIL